MRTIESHYLTPEGCPVVWDQAVGWKEMLEKYLTYLNAHMEATRDPVWDEEPSVLADYWDEYGDKPGLMLDTAMIAALSNIYTNKSGPGARLVQISCTPYHDEGGPATLTASFSWDDGMRFDRQEPGHWELDWMVAEFDTIPSLIWGDGKMQSMPEGWEQEVR